MPESNVTLKISAQDNASRTLVRLANRWMAELILELADHTNRGHALYAITYNPATDEATVTSTAPDSDGNALYRDEDGQQYYGHGYDENHDAAHDPEALVILLDAEGLQNMLDSDGTNDDGMPTDETADDLAGWLISENRMLLAVGAAKSATAAMNAATAARSRAVVRLVEVCGGNQTQAARLLGLDPSTVNKLVQRAKATSAPEPTTEDAIAETAQEPVTVDVRTEDVGVMPTLSDGEVDADTTDEELAEMAARMDRSVIESCELPPGSTVLGSLDVYTKLRDEARAAE